MLKYKGYCRKADTNVLLTDTNECDSNPCTNGATCNNEVNAYNCTCVEGYIGYNCETGVYFVDPIVQKTRSVSYSLAGLRWF